MDEEDKLILEEVQELHLQTIEDGINAKKKFRSDKALAYRIFRNAQYVKDVRSPTQKTMSDISIRVLVTACIYGSWTIEKRKNSKMADIDLTLDYDEKFYDGLWKIASKRLMGEVIKKPPFLESFEEVEELYDDVDATNFTLREAQEEYIAYSVLHDGPLKTYRDYSRMMDFHVNFLEFHPYRKKRDGRPEPFNHVLKFYFNCQRFKNEGTFSPPDFWDKYSDLALKYLQQSLINDLFLAKEYHKEQIIEQTGYTQ